VIFVDTNVFMYAVGKSHPLREDARSRLLAAVETNTRLFTSAEVLQELLHAYLAAGRHATLDAAFTLVDGCVDEVWSIDREDLHLARALDGDHPSLAARDLIHLACCRRRGVKKAMTFDRALGSVLG
jgi:predicted nucleic acid-binding protein